MEFRKMVMIILYTKQKETQMYRTDFWTLWEKARVGCFERTASKHVHYLWWNRSPAQVGCMRQVLGPGALGRCRGIGWRGRWEGGSGWGIHVNPWQIHVTVWQKPLQYCKVISLQLIKINEKKLTHSSDSSHPSLLVSWHTATSFSALSYPSCCHFSQCLGSSTPGPRQSPPNGSLFPVLSSSTSSSVLFPDSPSPPVP